MPRAILTATIEYYLAYKVFKHGKTFPRVIALMLFFLASYQMGEVIMFATDGASIGFRIAYFSTTLLPALGLELIEKVTGKPHYYLPFQIIGIVFALIFLIQPGIIAGYEHQTCCFIATSYTNLGNIWGLYYQGALIFSMIAIVINLFMKYKREVKTNLSYLLLAYIVIESGIFVARYIPEFNMSTASVMCALALVAALIFARLGLRKKQV
ncbi:MAG TPA: hypothetical protein ENI23_14145 [bacterium]|nr:hypothetical protein [bacterium]